MPSSPPNTTTVTISATVSIVGTIVNVNTGTKDFVFTLSQPVTLGSIDNFIDWLNKTLGLPVTSQQVTDLANNIPDVAALQALKNAFLDIFSSPITLTALSINYAAGTYAFGVATTFTNPIGILGLLEFQGIGIYVSNTSPVTSP